MSDDLRRAGELQARVCRENGSPTYEAVLQALLTRLDDDHPAVELLRSDPGHPWASGLFLRLLGAVHRLALVDEACPLRAYFPSTGGRVDVDAVVPVFFDVVAERAPVVAEWMQAEVQTNEVGRSAPLSAAVNWVVERLGGPVRLLEVGASAGLNLWLDRYRVVAGSAAWGPPDSPVQLLGHFADGSPPTPELAVVERRGCDLHPLDLTDPSTAVLLRSFVWPEHVDRLARLDAGLRVAEPVPIDRSAASPWIGARLAELDGDEGVTTVVFHSVVMQYLDDDEVARFESILRAMMRRHPRLAWVAMEPTRGYGEMRVTAELGGERYRLATCTPHGEEISWDPTTPSGSPGV